MSTVRQLLDLIDEEDRFRLLVVLVLMTIGSLAEAVGIGLVLPYLEAMTEPTRMLGREVAGPVLEWAGITQPREVQVAASVGLVAVFVGKNVYIALMWRRVYRFLFEQYAKLASEMLEGYLAVPYTFHLERNTAQLIRNVTSEADRIFNGAVQAGIYVLTEGFIILGLAAVLVFAHTMAAGIVFLILALGGWFFTGVWRERLEESGDRRAEHRSRMIQAVNEGLGGLKETKLMGREGSFLRKFRTSAETVADSLRENRLINQYPQLFLETGAVVGMVGTAAALLFTGAGLTDALPLLGVFGVAAVRLMPSVNRVVGNVNTLRYQGAAVRAVHSEIEEIERWREDAPGGSRDGEEVLHLRDRIRLDRVSYAYPKADVPALHEVDLTVHRGEHVGVVGPSGAGKTTLVDLVLGLLSPSSGTIRVDGADIHENLPGWQRSIGYIPQDVYLTDDTVRSNVAFGLPEERIDDDGVWRALEAAQVAGFIRGQKEGLDSVVGERGVKLSGGQRQRIAIARALYHNPDVLVLDEATANLDYKTEDRVLRAIDELSGRKTIITVTHRLNSVKRCDTVHVLRQGRLVDSGSYDEVRKTSATFRQMAGSAPASE